MPLFNWPYTNLHNLNLDWIIKKIKNVETAESNTAASEEAAAGSAASAAESEANAAESETNAAASATSAGNYYNQIRENVSTLVTGWLDEHVTPTSTVVDSSLSISGAAADAKATGDGLTDLKNDVNVLDNAMGSGLFIDGTAIDFSSNITDNVWVSGNVGETLTTHSAGATAHAFFDVTAGNAYKISFQALQTVERTYVFAVDANGVILKTWVTAALVANERRDVYVIAPPNTAKIYFNFQRYNYKAVCNATRLSVENAFPMPSRNDWKKAFRLQDNFVWEGYYIKADNGVMHESSAWKSTDFIPVKAGDVLLYRLNGSVNPHSAICFYDEHKVYISSIPYVVSDGYFANGSVTVENDGFIRLSVDITDISSWLVWDEYNPTDSTKHAIEQHTVIADFLEDEYKKTIESLQTVNSANGSSFIFFTDLHYAVNHRYNSLQNVMERNYTAIKKLSDEYPIAVVVAGGDYEMLGNVASGVTKQDGLDIIYHMNRYMSQIGAPKIAMCGNHELGYKSGGSSATISGTDNGLSAAEIYQYIGKKYATDPIVKVGNNVYYLSDHIGEVFYLFCSTAESGSLTNVVVANDIISAINANSEHYPIVIFNHYSLNDSGEIYSTAITTTINTIVNAGHSIIAWIGGHNHADWCNTVDVNGTKVLVISCLQSGVLNSNQSEDGNTYTHTVGTDTESAFSVFTINKELGKLYLTRFGAGVDREFNYNTTSGNVGIIN